MTNPPDLQELIHADIDGTASPAERVRLRELLAANPAARAEHERLAALSDLLACVAPEAHPETLRGNIMRAVRAEKARRSIGFWQKVAPSWLSGRAVLPLAYAAAAGAAIGIVGFHIVTGQGAFDASERDAAATIGSRPTGAEAGRTPLTGAGVQGSATVRRIDSTLAVDVDLPTSSSLDVQIAYDPAAVKFIGVANRSGVTALEVAGGRLSWHAVSSERVTVFFVPQTGDTSPLNISFNAGGARAGGGTLGLPGR